jgi:hypothetical protein
MRTGSTQRVAGLAAGLSTGPSTDATAEADAGERPFDGQATEEAAAGEPVPSQAAPDRVIDLAALERAAAGRL